MADKTSWTKPPPVHRYGDSKLAECDAESASGPPVPPPPQDCDERSQGSRGPARGGGEMIDRKRASSEWGTQILVGIRRAGVGRQWRGHDVSTRGTQSRERGRRGEELSDVQPFP